MRYSTSMPRLVVRLVLACVLAACSFESELVPCGALLCPKGTVCTPGGCAARDEANACVGLADGEPCTTPMIMDGTCTGGSCQRAFCGNGILDLGEVCDDGNQLYRDGCAGDCQSDERCGNGVVDVLEGESCDSGLDGVSGDGCTSTCASEIETWRDVTPRGITPRSRITLAHDSDRGVLVVFGGIQVLESAETWEWDGVNWLLRVPGRSPPARASHALTYDPLRKRTVLFGGSKGNLSVGDMWLWDGVAWTEVTVGLPPARGSAHMVFDVARGVVVLYGGITNGAVREDTWEWNGTSWTEAASSSPMGARSSFGLAYDPTRSKVILYSGTPGATETWEWNGSTWTRIATAGPARGGFVLASDPPNNRVLLFGGSSGLSLYNDTYAWNGSAWSLLSVGQVPPGRSFAGMAYDARIGEVVLFGGNAILTGPLGDTWSFNGTDWTERAFLKPVYRHRQLTVYDPLRGVVMLNGGIGISVIARGDQWLWDGLNWRRDTPPVIPARAGHAGAFDAARGHIVTFGGRVNGIEINGTYVWDGTSWSAKTVTSTLPHRRADHGMAYDVARKNVVMFGGVGLDDTGAGFYRTFDDTWLWDGTAWTQATPSSSPSIRERHVMVYDVARERVVVHGGLNDQTLGDTWEWDGATWSRHADGPVRSDHAAAYDPLRQRVIVWAGIDAQGVVSSDTWEWDGLTWSPGTPLDRPTARYGSALAYDAVNRRMLMSGGRPIEELQITDAWTRTFESVTVPRERCLIAAEDGDGDGSAGCADPDCFGRCTPLCPPGATCDPGSPRCGDDACGPVEDYLICPQDCSPP